MKLSGEDMRLNKVRDNSELHVRVSHDIYNLPEHLNHESRICVHMTADLYVDMDVSEDEIDESDLNLAEGTLLSELHLAMNFPAPYCAV